MLFEKSADAKTIEAILETADVGQTVTYQAISTAIGRDVRKFSLSALNTARRGLQKEKGMVFGIERNVGLVRLDDAKIVDSVEGERLKVHRISNRALDRLSKVDFSKLDEKARKSHITASTQFGVMAMFSHRTASKKIEGKVNTQSSMQLPIGETLKLFGAS